MLTPVKPLPVHRDHSRVFDDFRFVYPVVSRRSGGLSIGLNVNPDKRCNFDCLYCQVDRTVPAPAAKFDVTVAEQELRTMLAAAAAGEVARHPRFAGVPAELLTLRDIALSGDGEPTTLPDFAAAVAMVARVKPAGVKLVLITDAAGLDRPAVQRGLAIMDAHDGEVWGKLDAGTAEYYRFINRTRVPFEKVLRNLASCARERAIVVQSLFLKAYGQGPTATEIAAYVDRLEEIVAAGGQIKQVQICTLARRAMTLVAGRPAWQFVEALSDAEVDAIVASVRHQTGLSVAGFYGASE